MDKTSERIRRIFGFNAIFLSFHNILNFVNIAVACAILLIIPGIEPPSIIVAPRYMKLWTSSIDDC